MTRVLVRVMAALPLLLVGCATQKAQMDYMDYEVAGEWDWKNRFFHEIPNTFSTLEVVPEGQTVDNWTEMLTQHEYSKKVVPESPIAFMDELKAKMEQRCKNVVWDVLEQTSTSVLYEWRIRDCAPHADQHEIARMLDGQWNRFQIRYTKKVIEIPAETRRRWIESLSSAHVRMEPSR